MDLQSGTPTLHCRAEAWECDFNGHWNTRYYCKAFQTAASVVRMLAGDTSATLPPLAHRQLRFHAELHSGDAITVRSFHIPDADAGALTAHYMFRYDRIVATAVDFGGPENRHLTHLSAADAALALPRGITGEVTAPWTPDVNQDFLYELGPADESEQQSDGTLPFWISVARMSHASHHHDLRVGFTLELMKDQAIGRMLVEMRYTPLGPCETGAFLRCASRMTSAKGKAFAAAHMLYTHRGTPVAMFELCTLSVDMKSRRAMDLPAFVTGHMASLAGQ